MKIRTVKPEFWQSEKLATRTSRDTRLLLIGLICMADDHGRFRAHPSLIRGEVFPYEPDAPIEVWLAELVALGIVRLYQAGGQQYGVVVNFAEHQKIDRRWTSKLPAPPHDPGPGAPKNGGGGPAATPPPPPATAPPASLAEQPESPAKQPARLADSTPTDRIGSEGKGKEPLRTRACAREGPGSVEPQKQSGGRSKPSDQVLAIQAALLAAGYRSETRPEGTRSKLVLARAIEFDASGGTIHELEALIAIDREKSKTPGALLAVWLDRGRGEGAT